MNLHRRFVEVDRVAADACDDDVRLFPVSTGEAVNGQVHVVGAGALAVVAGVAAVVRAAVNRGRNGDANAVGVRLEPLVAAALVVALLVDALLCLQHKVFKIYLTVAS